MDGTGITPVMNMGNDGNGFMWIFGLLILLGLMNGGGFMNNGGNANAIQADVNRGFDNQNLQAQTRDILGAVTSGTAQSVAASNQVYHDLVSSIYDKYGELQRDVAALSVAQQQGIANQNECCCTTKMLIQQTASDNALAMAQMEARLTAKMDANEIQALRDKVSALELAQATSNIVRYPTSTVYSSGNNPFCNGGCNGINI